jgi:fructokinase
VHFGGISLARPPLSDRLVAMAIALNASGVAISYDPNFRNLMDAGYTPTFERMCRLAQMIKLSDEDLVGLTGTADPMGSFARIRAWNPQAWWLYTLGAAGAHLFTPAGHWRASPPAIAVVDTVGAGDACIAGLLASRMQRPDEDSASHLAYAVAAGAAACATAGASPPSRDAVRFLMEHTRAEPV